jgi:hypothetical protein
MERKLNVYFGTVDENQDISAEQYDALGFIRVFDRLLSKSLVIEPQSVFLEKLSLKLIMLTPSFRISAHTSDNVRWGRSPSNPVGGWYGTMKELCGRFAMYVPPVIEELKLAEVEHNPKNNRMKAL